MAPDKRLKNESNDQIKNDGSSVSQQRAFDKFESQFNFPSRAESVLKNSMSEQAMENIKYIFNKTQTVKKVADENHKEIQAQFQELKTRLNKSSESLTRLKKGIDNVKFSFQTKLFEMNRTLTNPLDYCGELNIPQTKEDVKMHIEDIKNKIENIQNIVQNSKQKQETVTQNYKDAFDNVSKLLERIDKGDYSSVKLEK